MCNFPVLKCTILKEENYTNLQNIDRTSGNVWSGMLECEIRY